MKIFKYVLQKEQGEQLVSMPHICHPLSFGYDPAGELCVWAMVQVGEPNWGDNEGRPWNPTVEQRFFVAFTGQDAPDLPLDVMHHAGHFLGTVQRGPLMIHGFYIGEKVPRP